MSRECRLSLPILASRSATEETLNGLGSRISGGQLEKQEREKKPN